MSAELGILIADPARLDEALARIAHPEQTQIFLMDDGVLAARDPRLRALLDQGADISLCAMDAEARSLSPDDGGPRFGSQYDHAQMIRDAARIVACTRAKIEESRPHVAERRRVQVSFTGDASDRATAQGLRAAVAYLGCDLRVGVVLEPAARALADRDPPPELARHLATLRALDVVFFEPPGSGPPPIFDVRVSW
jgi:hypothetical protein